MGREGFGKRKIDKGRKHKSRIRRYKIRIRKRTKFETRIGKRGR